MKYSSIKFEITVLYTAILGLILIVFSVVLFLISNAYLHQIDKQLKIKAESVDYTINSYLNVLAETHDGLVQSVNKTLAIKKEGLLQYKTAKISQNWVKQAQSLNLSRDYVIFISEDGKEFYSSPNLDNRLRTYFLENIQFPLGEQTEIKTLNVKHKNIRVINYPFTDRTVGQYVILVGEPQEPIVQQLHKWLFSLAISIPLVLIVTSFVGRILANRILRPVYEITALANRITQQDLTARIKNKNFGTEMDTLVGSFNEMIARLEKSFKHIEQFSYHVAHELKTPLTIIQGEADLMLRKDRPIHEYKQALRIVMEESKRVRQTVDDLLLLTKLGYQPEALNFEDFDFLEFFNEIVDQNILLAANKEITINTDIDDTISPLIVKGDRLHLRRLFFNIIDNAVKFTPKGGKIDLKVRCSNKKIVTSIADSGPGIAKENLDKIFDEFFRADSDTAGSGLGLYIAKTIAKLHQGDIQVESQIGLGTTFKVILPF